LFFGSNNFLTSEIDLFRDNLLGRTASLLAASHREPVGPEPAAAMPGAGADRHRARYHVNAGGCDQAGRTAADEPGLDLWMTMLRRLLPTHPWG
jgi:hypothetical protein